LCFVNLLKEEVGWANFQREVFQGMGDCTGVSNLRCQDKTLALHLKGDAIALIMGCSALGVALPLVGRRLQWLKTDGIIFSIAKAFAAGVILATGFVHMLPSAMESLRSECLPRFPWHEFPFAGFIAMLASLVTLVIDFVATEYYELQHEHSNSKVSKGGSNPELTTDVPAHACKFRIRYNF